MRTRPKAAQKSSVASFSECSAKPRGRLSTLAALCHWQAGLSSFWDPLQGHLLTWVLPAETPDLSTVHEWIAFCRQGPQIGFPSWGWDLRAKGNERVASAAFSSTSPSASPLRKCLESHPDPTANSSYHPPPRRLSHLHGNPYQLLCVGLCQQLSRQEVSPVIIPFYRHSN